MCDHTKLRIDSFEARKVGERIVLSIDQVSCRDCGTALAGIEGSQVRVLPAGFEVEMVVVGLDPGNLRCPSCKRRLFGVSQGRGATFERGPILGVECGEPHVVRLSDATLGVGENMIWVIDEQE